MNHSLGTLLAQKNEEVFEQAIYYLSQTLIRAECRYNPAEKKMPNSSLCHTKDTAYWVGQTIHVISRVNFM